MKERNLILLTGTVVNYDLTISQLTNLLYVLSTHSSYSKISENVYYVPDIELLEDLYAIYTSNKVYESTKSIIFFCGEYACIKVLDTIFQKYLEQSQTMFSCSEIMPDVYKVYPLQEN